MLYNKRPSLLLSLLLILVISLTACGAPQPGAQTLEDYGFIVKGVSGKEVMLDVTWYRDCVSGGEGTWTKSMRTLSGHELVRADSRYLT